MCVFSFVWQHFRLCSFWLQQQAQMASTLEKQLVASQNFLGGCRNLPAFQTIRQRQWEVLSKALDKVDGLSTEKAAQIIGILDEDLWGSFSESLGNLLGTCCRPFSRRSRIWFILAGWSFPCYSWKTCGFRCI